MYVILVISEPGILDVRLVWGQVQLSSILGVPIFKFLMKNLVIFTANDNGLYQAIVNGKVVPLLLAHHQALHTLKLLERFKDWEREDNDYFRMLVAGACKIAMCDKI